MSSNGSTVASVSSLKIALSKELVKLEKYKSDNNALSSAFYERCGDMLDQLDKLPIDLPILSSTLIGTVVTKFKKCDDENLVNKAKEIVKKWKGLAKSGGATSVKPASQQGTVAKSSVKAQINPPVKAPINTPVKAQISPPVRIASPAPSEWNSLPTLRKNICVKLYEILLENKNGHEKQQIIKVCTELESALNNFSKNNSGVYKEKARSICFNLKRNASLRNNILEGLIEPSKVMTMSTEELATNEKKAEREKLEKDLQDSRRLDWEQANEEKINDMCGIKGDLLNASLFTCGRCKSTKTTSTQKQTRSADEPMTVFVFCMNCGNRWKC